jgi:hypothetical protein
LAILWKNCEGTHFVFKNPLERSQGTVFVLNAKPRKSCGTFGERTRKIREDSRSRNYEERNHRRRKDVEKNSLERLSFKLLSTISERNV